MARRGKNAPVQVGRILYVLVGCFFVSAEIAYFWFHADWFKWSALH
jgi:hypothetical protein